MKIATKFLLTTCSLVALTACGGKKTVSDSANVDSSGTAMQTTLQDEFNAKAGDRVFFSFDKSSLDQVQQDTLRRQARFFKENPSMTATIEGHADERGTREYNLALGERRANSAKKCLKELGVDCQRLSTVSYGKERPVVQGSNEEAWAQNRVAITVVRD
ncbi:peptidoglycan-associated lipoprotein Pal [Candidatus Lariskella endosymbiont of Hedychridium roseum]|uniref:peptidoglycan-associated lipoprotein Pal n=1 Tax=Candidatus Lariskella endosymbiont of Hedychridium roseum TaxID=3077949 RepID=UPI0030D41587